MQARLERRDQMGGRDLMVHKVRLAPPVLTVLQVSLDLRVQLVPPDQQEVMVRLDLQGRQAQMALLVLLDLPGHRELTVHQVLLASLGLKVSQDRQVRLDPQDQQALMVLRVSLDHRGRRGPRV
jgi:hypothetical protein